MTWKIKQSIAHGPGGGDRYVYGIQNVEDDQEVAHFFNKNEADKALSLMEYAYKKGDQNSARHVPLLLILSLVVVFLIGIQVYKNFIT